MSDSDRAGWLESLRERAFSDVTPADIVSGPGLTREDLQAQSDAFQTWREGTVGGRVVLDVDGCPTGVEPVERVPVMFGGAWISAATADRLGVGPGDFLGVRIIGRG